MNNSQTPNKKQKGKKKKKEKKRNAVNYAFLKLLAWEAGTNFFLGLIFL